MRFCGELGFGVTAETPPNSGVWEDVITEKGPYFGDVLRNTRQSSQGENLNNDISVNNSIGIVASDDYAGQNFMSIRYIRWSGNLWHVTEVEVQGPRLLLQVGGVYNGEIAAGATRSAGVNNA